MPKPTVRNRRQSCLDLSDSEHDLLFTDGHDDAILGIAERDGLSLIVYDTARILRTLRRRDGISREEAEEFFEYNIAGSYMGELTPIFLGRVR